MKNYIVYFSILIVCLGISCQSTRPKNKTTNSLLSLWLPFVSERTRQAFNHSLIKSHRYSSDCGATCPAVDVWQYLYKPHNKVLQGTTPFSLEEQYWKSPHEARVIAISLFGKEFYYTALLQYLESFKKIKEANNISDPVWGYETFIVRVYTPKRNPLFLEKLGPIKNGLSQDKIDKLLSLGCEIAYTDNHLPAAQLDASFWRFTAMADEMPDGKRLRYLMRDADFVLTGVELFSVAEWIKSDKKYHRMHVIPICIGPLTASLWGGTHTGKGDFHDFNELVKNYPYRFEYGDDELFSRDLLWPRLKATGSILTHHFPRKASISALASPYWGSCEEPTQDFCKKLNEHSQCEDRILPDSPKLQGAVEALGMRMTTSELYTKHPEYFDLELENPERTFIYEAFKAKK